MVISICKQPWTNKTNTVSRAGFWHMFVKQGHHIDFGPARVFQFKLDFPTGSSRWKCSSTIINILVCLLFGVISCFFSWV